MKAWVVIVGALTLEALWWSGIAAIVFKAIKKLKRNKTDSV
jgi:hypothetical protein